MPGLKADRDTFLFPDISKEKHLCESPSTHKLLNSAVESKYQLRESIIDFKMTESVAASV